MVEDRGRNGDDARAVDEAHVPIGDAGRGVGIEGVHAVVLGRDEDDVVHAAGDGEVRNVERLCVGGSIGRALEELAEAARGTHQSGRECIFVQVLTGACVVTVTREDTRQIRDGDRRRARLRSIGSTGGANRMRTECAARRVQAACADHSDSPIAAGNPVNGPLGRCIARDGRRKLLLLGDSERAEWRRDRDHV